MTVRKGSNTISIVPPVNVAPYSQQAEESLLGAVIAHAPSYYAIAAFLHSDMFYLLRSRLVWEAIVRCMIRDKTVDMLTICDELTASGDLDHVGGFAYIMQITNDVPTHIHAEVYARLIERAATRRKLLKAAERIKDLALDESTAIESVITESQSTLIAATLGGTAKRDASMRDIMLNVGSRLDAAYDARMRGETTLSGIPTGFDGYDKLLGGLQNGTLIILAAPTGVGKSAAIASMLVNMGRQTIVRNDVLRPIRIGGFTMEMDAEQYGDRLLSIYTGISTVKIREGWFTAQEHYDLTNAQAAIGAMKIMLDDSSQPTPEYVVAKCNEWRMQGGLDFVFVDYLQNMGDSEMTFGQPAVYKVGYKSKMLKALARDLNIPVMAACQLSRDIYKRTDKRPMLSDLRDSGEIEQDADVVTFIHRESVFNDATEHPNSADFIVAKHRNGPTGAVGLYFNRACVRFENGEVRRVSLDEL